MQVGASILVLKGITHEDDVSWASPLKCSTVLEIVAQNCQQARVIDDMAIITDDPALIEKGEHGGVRVVACPENMRNHNFNFLNIELYRILRERDFVIETGVPGNINFFIPWNMPLLTGQLLERMYHALLESPSAARMLPMTPVDPHLFTRMGHDGGYFPVWCQKAQDRQRIPQLYRTRPACVAYWDRLTRTVPSISGFPITRIEGQMIRNREELGLVEFLMTRQP